MEFGISQSLYLPPTPSATDPPGAVHARLMTYLAGTGDTGLAGRSANVTGVAPPWTGAER